MLEWEWNILPADEVHFHFRVPFNTQISRICASRNPLEIKPSHFILQMSLCCWEFIAAFVVDPFFFEEIRPSYPVTRRVSGTHYESILSICTISSFQHWNIYVWIAQFLWKMAFLHVLQHQWSSCSISNLEMTKLSAATFQQPGRHKTCKKTCDFWL